MRVGVDLAKRTIRVHAVDCGGKVLTNRPPLSADNFLPWCRSLPVGCLVVMVVSSGAHYRARKLLAMGLEARIVSAHLAAPYRSEGHMGKNDASDGAANCEAASRPHMRFMPVNNIEQQRLLCVHRLREGFKADRTARINGVRSLPLDFILTVAQGARSPCSYLGRSAPRATWVQIRWCEG